METCMRGTEITDAQMDAAEKFILLCRTDGNTKMPKPEESVSMPWANIVRIVAWYGAIRAKAVADGNSVDEVGETYKTGKEK
jgi:hypothetical protein